MSEARSHLKSRTWSRQRGADWREEADWQTNRSFQTLQEPPVDAEIKREIILSLNTTISIIN